MKTYTITEGKAQLSALVKEVLETGKPIVIGRAGSPMVKLVPYQPQPSKNRIGGYEGKIQIAHDFDNWDDEESVALGLKDD